MLQYAACHDVDKHDFMIGVGESLVASVQLLQWVVTIEASSAGHMELHDLQDAFDTLLDNALVDQHLEGDSSSTALAAVQYIA